MQQKIIAAVERRREGMRSIAEYLFAHPEVSMQEHASAAYLTDWLEQEGFAVERGLGGLPTAFRATARSGSGPRLAFIAEYDALEGIGHACGHHLIAAMSLCAAAALREALAQYQGEIAVIGTPGEELAQGKPCLIEQGVFEGYDAAMMIHPSTKTTLYPPTLCLSGIEFQFTGKAAHAGTAPDRGVNALDAVVLLYTAVNALREQLRDGTRVHGIILEAGSAVNVIPDRGRVRMEVRTADTAYFQEVIEKVVRCAQAAALATGCTLTQGSFEPTCLAVKHDKALGGIFQEVMDKLGIEDQGANGFISTDMGNVSHVVRAIHPMLGMVDGADDLHTTGFLNGTRAPYASARALTGAKLLALTGLKILEEPGLLAERG